jgi:hypothetical protein
MIGIDDPADSRVTTSFWSYVFPQLKVPRAEVLSPQLHAPFRGPPPCVQSEAPGVPPQAFEPTDGQPGADR